MKLEQLLRESRSTIQDDGFTDRVMAELPLKKHRMLSVLDLSALEISAATLALTLLGSYFSSVSISLAQPSLSTLGTLGALFFAIIFWVTDGEMVDIY